MRRGLAAVLLLVLGAATGLAGIAVHDRSWAWFLLAAATPLATAYAVRPGSGRVAYAVGWFLLLMVAMGGRPEGDYAVASSVRGYALLALGLVLLCFAVATVRRRPPPRMAP